MIREWWKALRYKGRHSGTYSPMRHWNCEVCTSACGCPILLGTVFYNVQIYGIIGDPDTPTATATLEMVQQGPGPHADATRSADHGVVSMYPRGGERTRVRLPRRTHACSACGASTFGTHADTTAWFNRHAATHDQVTKAIEAKPLSSGVGEHQRSRTADTSPSHEVLHTPTPPPRECDVFYQSCTRIDCFERMLCMADDDTMG